MVARGEGIRLKECAFEGSSSWGFVCFIWVFFKEAQYLWQERVKISPKLFA